jgi:hypothetical protein
VIERKLKPWTPRDPNATRPADPARGVPRSVSEPVPGLYEVKLRRTAPSCAAQIILAPTPDPDFPGNEMDRSLLWRTEINGAPDPEASPTPTERTYRVWHSRFLRAVGPERYDYLIRDRAWARAHRPELPEARPEHPVDPARAPLAI